MPTKLKPRWKLFGQHVAAGKSATDAYTAAGFKAQGQAIRKNASRLLTNADVAAYIAEIQARGAARTEVTIEKVIREVARIAFAQATDFASWDGTSLTLTPSSKLTEDAVAAIAGVTYKTFKGETTVEFRLHSKDAALDKLMRRLGLYKDSMLLKGKVSIDQLRELAGLAGE